MKRSTLPGRVVATLLFLTLGGGSVAALASDLKLQAQLIWGTNGEKPDDPKVKALDPKLTDKLCGVFKWKTYYEVKRQDFTVGRAEPKRVKMSERCEIEVQNLGNSLVEVKLYGKGRLVVTKKQVITPGELLILAGDDKNNTAWFVILALDKS